MRMPFQLVGYQNHRPWMTLNDRIRTLMWLLQTSVWRTDGQTVGQNLS